VPIAHRRNAFSFLVCAFQASRLLSLLSLTCGPRLLASSLSPHCPGLAALPPPFTTLGRPARRPARHLEMPPQCLSSPLPSKPLLTPPQPSMALNSISRQLQQVAASPWCSPGHYRRRAPPSTTTAPPPISLKLSPSL
jgi:hypothetical protein